MTRRRRLWHGTARVPCRIGVWASLLGCALGCSSSGGAQHDSDAVDCQQSASRLPSAEPPASYQDVNALTARSCAFQFCHGQKSLASAGLYLGEGGLAAARNRPATEAAGLFVISPGHPEESFLQLKLEGTMAACAGADCAAGCGDGMPPGAPLSAAERDAFRSWIRAGANVD